MFRNQFMREMHAGEEDAVEALLRAAFGQPDEATLVRKLRKQGVIAGEAVVPGEDGPVGYVALSDMVAPKGWLCLAPVAVAPDQQGQGIGRRLCGMISEWARQAGQTVVVLGEPGFYQRAGFSLERAQKLASPFPLDHTLIARPGEDMPKDRLVYPKAFGATE
ncbi:putative acetyltransferase [Roseivivax marinus]|uniref:GNAT family N-acetyltransferase n=1 Tax=Roseivivax marinus TaxID=1379903 RepID=UPI0008D58179|nr:N-acetyltransferase [Roseivivax marinus]SEK38144.1 putative acetyltransferase [Roseivivax marinus]